MPTEGSISAGRKTGEPARAEASGRARKPFHLQNPRRELPPLPSERDPPPVFPISAEQFAELEHACGEKLDNELRANLAWHLKIVVDGDWLRPNNDERQEAFAKMQHCRTLISKTRRAFFDAQWRSLPGLRGHMLEIGQATYPADARLPGTEQEVMRTLVWLQRITQAAMEAMERTEPAAGAGHPELAALHYLVNSVAHVHLRAGGRLRPQKPQRSRFLDFVQTAFDLVKSHLPASFRTQSSEGLRKIAQKVIKEIESFNRRLNSQHK